jgi:glutamate synthase (NADPH/NADH) large chain
MGDDTPLAAFSDKQRNFTDFFKQKFAQVTNPPIDPIREKVVMSLNTGFGEIHNILDEIPSHAHRLKSISPIITREQLDVLKYFGDKKSPRYQAYYHNTIFSTAYTNDLEKSLAKTQPPTRSRSAIGSWICGTMPGFLVPVTGKKSST